MNINRRNTTYTPRLDQLSTAFSLVCVVHCIVLPVLVSTLPLFGLELVKNFYVDMATVLTTFLVGGLGLWRGCKRHHHRKSILYLFLSGIVLMVI